MNKQFLSGLLLTCFATSAYSVDDVYLRNKLAREAAVAAKKAAKAAAKAAGVGVASAAPVVSTVVETAPAAAAKLAEEAAQHAARNADTVAEMMRGEATRIANGLGFFTPEAMEAYLEAAPMNRKMMMELDAVNAKLWAQTPVLGKVKYYAGAAWNGTVDGIKSAYNATGSAATATAEWVKNHPGYATAAVAGVAAAGYLAYTYWPSSNVESLSAQDQVVVKASLKASMAQLMKQCPGQGFYKDGDFNKLAHREFFTGTPASYGVSKDTVWYLNDAVTCAHALNYIQRNNLKVEASVVKAIQDRLAKAQSKTAAVLAA